MNPNDMAPVIIVSLMSLVTGAVLILRGPLGKAMARRLEGNVGPSPELEGRIQDLEARLAASEEERIEIGERLDFAERMLLQAKEMPRELK